MRIRRKVGTWFFVFFLLCVPEVFAWQRPDTVQAKCSNDAVEIICPAPGQPFYGQDSQYQSPARSYTKLGQNGVALSDTATQENGWLVTRDNLTGLIWEMKTADGGIHDKDKTFTWCDKNPATNGGDQGTCGSGTGSAATDTEAFIKATNDAHFGGFSDWRLPAIKELSSLVNSSIPYPGPTFDAAWFPRTVSSYYWSSNTCAGYTYVAWLVYFSHGNDYYDLKSSTYYVRAVRAGQ